MSISSSLLLHRCDKQTVIQSTCVCRRRFHAEVGIRCSRPQQTSNTALTSIRRYGMKSNWTLTFVIAWFEDSRNFEWKSNKKRNDFCCDIRGYSLWEIDFYPNIQVSQHVVWWLRWCCDKQFKCWRTLYRLHVICSGPSICHVPSVCRGPSVCRFPSGCRGVSVCLRRSLWRKLTQQWSYHIRNLSCNWRYFRVCNHPCDHS